MILYKYFSRGKHIISGSWREIPFLFFNIKNSSILRATVIIALLPYDSHPPPNSSSKANHSVNPLASSWLELNSPSFCVHFHIDKYTGISVTFIFMHGPSLVPQWWRICMLMQAMWAWFLHQGTLPGERNDNSFHYFCLGNPSHRGAWWATVHGLQCQT